MSRRPKALPPPSRDQISRYFKPTLASTTTNIVKPHSLPSQETIKSTSLNSATAPPAKESVKIESMFNLTAIKKKTIGAKQPLRKMLSSKVRCDAKVDPNADKVWEEKYKPDVNLTTDDMINEAKKIQRNGGHVNLKLSYPWLWWQCWFESRASRYGYYEARRNHGVLCSCCENARYRAGFNVVKNLCEDCTRDKCQHPCDALVKKMEERAEYKLNLIIDKQTGKRRQINVITTKEVIDMKLQSGEM